MLKNSPGAPSESLIENKMCKCDALRDNLIQRCELSLPLELLQWIYKC